MSDSHNRQTNRQKGYAIVKTMEGIIRGLENATIQLENENPNFKTRTDLLQKEVKNLQDDVKELYPVSFHIDFVYSLSNS